MSMNLKDQISSDYKEAFKARDEKKVSVLRMLNSAIKNKELEKRAKIMKGNPSISEEDVAKQSVLIDEEIVGVIGTEIKRRKDSIEQFNSGGRPELAAGEEEELKILSVYMPEQMGEDELKKIIAESIKESGAVGAADIGKVMKVLMPRVKGKADGNLTNRLVKEELEK